MELNSSLRIRVASPDDCKYVLEIYGPFVTDNSVSLEYDLPSEDEIKQRIQSTLDSFPWLVCETVQGRKVVGYAYAGRHRARPGYQWIAETAVYVSPNYQRQGIAECLYKKLLDILRRQGYYKALAIIGGSNGSSAEFHRKLGFNFLATFESFGNKFGKWGDVTWFVQDLLEQKDNPTVPTPFPAIVNPL